MSRRYIEHREYAKHSCDPPYRTNEGDLWQCRCGKWWRSGYESWHRVMPWRRSAIRAIREKENDDAN